MSPRRDRRGHYALTLAASVGVLLALGGLSVDVGQALRARAETRSVADEAARAAVIALRRTGSVSSAEDAARRLVARDPIAGVVATVVSVEFGGWDDRDAVPTFDPAAVTPNAARVTLSRTGGTAVTATLSKLAGVSSYSLQAQATAATRSVHLAVAVDGRPGQTEADFLDARTALVGLLQRLVNAPAPGDEVALSLYDSATAWEVHPLTSVASEGAALLSTWSTLAPLSRAGTDATVEDAVDCTWNTGGAVDDFTSPAGGCYPSMPRAYSDELGSNPAAPLHQLSDLLTAATPSPAYRGLVLVMATAPTTVPVDAGTARYNAGYDETRFTATSTVPGTDATAAVTDALDTLDAAWNDLALHAWTVALGVTDDFVAAAPRGDGWSVSTGDPTTLAVQLARIADALPVAVVE